MLGPKPWKNIRYKQPRQESRHSEMRWFVGVDTEAYRDGSPFMICSSEGDVWTPAQVPECFFDIKFAEAHFLFFNMKYDAGALLRVMLSPLQMRQLARYKEVDHDACHIEYLPHKHLLLRRGNIRREFWDISQFYHSSLDRAAKKYLGEGKIEIETKSFTRRYVKRHFAEIARYCVHDAKLTARLGDYFKSKLNEFGVECCSLYSPASLSFRYFQNRIGIIDVWDFWRMQPAVLQLAHEAYQGGRFEVVKRGTFSGYEYDIVSAYPYEMSRLVDIRGSRVVRSVTPVPEARYAFLRCRVRHLDAAVPPCHGVLLNGVRVYALGTYHVTLTKAEYDYLTENGIEVTIHDGYWLVPDRRAGRPYKSIIEDLFAIKDRYKGKDAMLYSLTKIMMNGYYGRMANLNESHEEGTDHPEMDQDRRGEVTVYNAGSGWNPIYAAMITANTRLAVCRLLIKAGDSAIGTHTDSIITTKPLPQNLLSKNLGGLTLELGGPGLVWGCGMYDMAGHTAYRGFEMPEGFTWRSLFQEHPRRSKYRYRQLRVVSWTQASAWGDIEKTNVFQHIPKVIDLNADVKRLWDREKVRGYHLLAGLEGSIPRNYTETHNPWRRK